VGGKITPPRKTKDVKPIYPAEALSKKIGGIVIMEATIGEDGKVMNVRVTRSEPGLDEAAMQAVRGWEFTPTLVDGVPTPLLMSVTVNFAMSGQLQGSVRQSSPGAMELQAMRQGGGIAPAPARTMGALPGYPAKEKKGAIGVVRLRVTIDEKGRVREVRPFSDLREGTSGGLGKPFVDAATKAVKKWQYEPPPRSPVIYDVQLRFVPGQPTQDVAPWRGAIPR
jgi:TonB family protein